MHLFLIFSKPNLYKMIYNYCIKNILKIQNKQNKLNKNF